MVNFKQFLLEYQTKEKSLFFGANKIRAGRNGKVSDRSHLRKHKNMFSKEYEHKSSLVDSVVNKGVLKIDLDDDQFNALLKNYNIIPEVGVKTLGNSGAEIEMYKDNHGYLKGILRKKQDNGM